MGKNGGVDGRRHPPGNQGFRGNGTAWSYIGRDIEYRMAGKSGTAQVVEISQGEEYDEEELSEFDRKHAGLLPLRRLKIRLSR